MATDLQFFDPPVYQLQIFLTHCRPLNEETKIPKTFRMEFRSSPEPTSLQHLHAAQEITAGSGKNVFVTAANQWIRLSSGSATCFASIQRIYNDERNPISLDIKLIDENRHEIYQVQVLISACEIGRRIPRSICENYTQTPNDLTTCLNVAVQTETEYKEVKRVNNAFVQTDIVSRPKAINNSVQTDYMTATTSKIIMDEKDVRSIVYQLIVLFAQQLHENFNEKAKMIKPAARKDKWTATEISIPLNTATMGTGILLPIELGSQHFAIRQRLRNLIKITRMEKSASLNEKIRKLRKNVIPLDESIRSNKTTLQRKQDLQAKKLKKNTKGTLIDVTNLTKEVQSPKSAPLSIGDKRRHIDDDLESLPSPSICSPVHSRSVTFTTNSLAPTPTNFTRHLTQYKRQEKRSSDGEKQIESSTTESTESESSGESSSDSEESTESQSASSDKSISEEVNAHSNAESSSSIVEELASNSSYTR